LPLELPSATSAPLRFLAALSRLIPPPRVHRHRYHGVLAPNARLRRRVVTLGRDDAPAPLARIYEVFPLTCPGCGAEMRILALPSATSASLRFITAAEPVDAILAQLGLPTTAPLLSPARGPPQHDLAYDAEPGFEVDQTPAHDPTEPERVPNFDFDQSAGA
jgi:hypothetical protein